jgi:hydrogenase maturation protein HypF
MADNGLDGDVLGVAWDGAGYGPDGTVWGGEFLRVDEESFKRVGFFRRFRLPGGETAVREPRRSALGALYEVFGPRLLEMDDLPCMREFPPATRNVLVAMLEKKLNAPETSSVGRLFDAVAAVTGLRQVSTFEGQAAMDLEFVIGEARTDYCYPFEIAVDETGPDTGALVVDWRPLLQSVVEDVRGGGSLPIISARFHNALAESVCRVATRIGLPRVALSGGCFQNGYLAERTICRLRDNGFEPYWHQHVPPNDGGIALGQAVAAARVLRKKETVCV